MTSPPRISGVSEGEVISGKYRIDRVIGAGGMGVVVAAHHLQLDERVAIKFLAPEALGSQEAVVRFAREARAAVKIKSEHVVRVIDVGTLDTGAPYMVMEYLEGRDLSAWLEQNGPMPVDQAVEFVLQACEALAEAHALGMVHRDLKPGNLFAARRPDGSVSIKVLDFGISKVAGPAGDAGSPGSPQTPGGPFGMTKTSALMGSPLYMSPEQMRSAKEVDARSDIWALGIILYELVTNVSPFTDESMTAVVLRIASSPPPAMQSIRNDVPAGLEAVILRCLEKDRGKRFETVGELAMALVAFGTKRSRSSIERISGVMRGAGLSGTALKLPPSSDGAGGGSSPTGLPTVPAWGRTAPGAPRGKLVLSGAALVLVGAGAAAVVLGARASRGGDLLGIGPPARTGTEASRSAEPPPSGAAASRAASAESASPAASESAVPTDLVRSAPLSTSPKPQQKPTGSAALPANRPGKKPAAEGVSGRPRKPGCDPNYYLDAQGEKHFKPECF